MKLERENTKQIEYFNKYLMKYDLQITGQSPVK